MERDIYTIILYSGWDSTINHLHITNMISAVGSEVAKVRDYLKEATVYVCDIYITLHVSF